MISKVAYFISSNAESFVYIVFFHLVCMFDITDRFELVLFAMASYQLVLVYKNFLDDFSMLLTFMLFYF